MREKTAFERIVDAYPPTYYCERHPSTEALECALCYGEKVARLDAHQAKFKCGRGNNGDPCGEPDCELCRRPYDSDADYLKAKEHPDLVW